MRGHCLHPKDCQQQPCARARAKALHSHHWQPGNCQHYSACPGAQPLHSHRWHPSACAVAGCTCLPEWNYTSSLGNHFHITTGCANPDKDFPTPWCQVNPATCEHPPTASSGGIFWGYCYNQDDKITIDTGAACVHACPVQVANL